jgi:uncharacterized RDD family membrane protein YckC
VSIEPGWYPDPAEPTTQRYWDGEGWLGDPVPADVQPPATPPVARAEATAVAPAPLATPPATPVPPAHPWPVPPSLPQPGTLPPTSQAPHGPGAHGHGPSWPPGWPPGWPAGYPYPAAVLPEPRPHGFRLAGAGPRFVARLVDILAVLVLCVIANAWFAIEFWRDVQPYFSGVTALFQAGQTNVESLPPPPDSANILLALMSVVATAVWFAYEVPASANSGQTLGKRLLGIKVVRLESEDQLGFGRALRRWSRLGLPTLFWAACCGLTVILQAIDCFFVVIDKPLRQALHDKSAATVVIELPRPGRPETARVVPPAS